jgi:hypothetical protein
MLWKREKSIYFTENEPRFLGLPAQGLIAKLTELSASRDEQLK